MLIGAIGNDLTEWRSYREGSQDHMPGNVTGFAVRKFMELWAGEHNTGAYVPPPLKKLLSERLGPDNLFLLQEMVSMNIEAELRGSPVDEVFSATPVPVKHTLHVHD